MSNCLIEAIKQRITNGYRVYYVKPKKLRLIPHFCWFNDDIGNYQHYTSNKGADFVSEIWFEGHIDNFPCDRMKVKLIRIL